MPISSSSTGQVSLNDIRTELGFPNNTNFNLNSAEDGGYVVLNRCSPQKPSSSNPASFSEWHGYDHNAACNATEFQAVQCDDFATTCDATFNATQALQSITLIPMTGVSRDGDGLNEDWYVLNAEKFPNIEINVYKPVGSTLEYFYKYTGPGFTSWNLVGNQGAYNGVSTGSGIYYYQIFYNDGVRGSITGYIYIRNPQNGDFYELLYSYDASSKATACSNTQTNLYTTQWPLTVGRAFFRGGEEDLTSYAPAGWYRRYNTNTVIQVGGLGTILSITTC